MRYKVVLEQQKEGGYVATVPALRGCVSQGDNLADALKNIREAAELYVKDCLDAGDPIPADAADESIEMKALQLAKSLARLKRLELRLRKKIDEVSLRGLADGPFLFASHLGRAAEASTNNGQWWVELWQRSDDPNAAPSKEVFTKSDDEAYQTILDWLRE
jgi:antitoxin HicB